jgi:CheY-like chemotaxis protein
VSLQSCMYERVRSKAETQPGRLCPNRWARMSGKRRQCLVATLAGRMARDLLRRAPQARRRAIRKRDSSLCCRLEKINVPPRILVVDDEANNARVMAIGLRSEGFEVETTSNADGALELLAQGPFDLAIVDLMMPGTNGMQLARLAREQHPRLRVVLTSAYHLSEPQLLRADCGAVGFVPKPFDLTELARFLKAKLSCGQVANPLGRAAS